MKGLLTVILLIGCSTQILCQEPVPGKLIWSSDEDWDPEPQVFSAFISEIPPPVGAIIEPNTACSADNNGTLKTFCNDANNCDATGFNLCTQTPLVQNCTGSTPYCTETSATAGDARCSETPGKFSNGTDCPAKVAPFDCTQFGILPDPSNCRRYYNCYKEAAVDTRFKAQAFECPNLYAYDPSLPEASPCRFTNNNAAYCIKSNCLNNDYGLQILKYQYLTAALGQIGVRCLGSPNIAPLVFKCGAYQTLSTDKFKPDCVLTCRSEGQKAPYREDITKYYQCFRGVSGLTTVLQSCLMGYKFDAQKLTCVSA